MSLGSRSTCPIDGLGDRKLSRRCPSVLCPQEPPAPS
jgi:hypothetical protein